MGLDSINAGKLDRRINILYPAKTRNSVRDTIETFLPWAEDIPAEFLNASGGGEDIKTLQNVGERHSVFIIRYREETAPKPQIPTATFQIIDTRYNQTYQVTKVEEMPLRRTGWIFYCTIKDNSRP